MNPLLALWLALAQAGEDTSAYFKASSIVTTWSRPGDTTATVPALADCPPGVLAPKDVGALVVRIEHYPDDSVRYAIVCNTPGCDVPTTATRHVVETYTSVQAALDCLSLRSVSEEHVFGVFVSNQAPTKVIESYRVRTEEVKELVGRRWEREDR